MVKGVNKTVIEVNNTGSRMFEKIVFYVAPQYGNVNPGRLLRAAGDISLRFDESGTFTPLRKHHRKIILRRWLLAAGLFLGAGTAVLLWLLL